MVSNVSAMFCCKRRSHGSAKHEAESALSACCTSSSQLQALSNLRLEFGRGFHRLRQLKLECIGCKSALERWVAFATWKFKGFGHAVRSSTLKFLKADRVAER